MNYVDVIVPNGAIDAGITTRPDRLLIHSDPQITHINIYEALHFNLDEGFNQERSLIQRIITCWVLSTRLHNLHIASGSLARLLRGEAIHFFGSPENRREGLRSVINLRRYVNQYCEAGDQVNFVERLTNDAVRCMRDLQMYNLQAGHYMGMEAITNEVRRELRNDLN